MRGERRRKVGYLSEPLLSTGKSGDPLLLTMFRLRGGWTRYIAALALLAVLALFKVSAGLLGVAALAGFLTERATELKKKMLAGTPGWCDSPARDFLVVSACWVFPSLSAFLLFLRGSAEVMTGYSGSSHVFDGSIS